MYDIVIVGAGASGTALFYTIAKYSNLTNFLLLEKYDAPGQVNSKAINNSQTLHVGDIETNYSMEKVRQVRPASMMVKQYAFSLPEEERDRIISKTQKMVLGVGEEDIKILEKRFEELKSLFPELRKLSGEEIKEVEPAVMEGRDGPVMALYNEEGYAVNFEELSASFIKHAIEAAPSAKVKFNSKVLEIKKLSDRYSINIENGERIEASVVIVDADSYSLLLAKSLGQGLNYSLIPIAGTFYFSPEILRGKVYTVQEPKLPFAAVHGDPDLTVKGKTRWGPTARFHPVLESYNFKTSKDYLRSSGLNRLKTWVSFIKILGDPVRLKYLLENMVYELPYFGKRLFVRNVRKIVPKMRTRDLAVAKHYGGMRLQRVDTDKGELQLGEGKIIGEKIIFNMTPSPGASVCLYNAMRDAVEIEKFLPHFKFRKDEMEKDFCDKELKTLAEVSLPEGYAS